MSTLPTFLGGVPIAARGKYVDRWLGSVGRLPLPTDPLFYADLTLQNIVVGSRYRITRNDTGAELATGVAGASPLTISGIPCFANPMQVDITVRNASGSTKYKVLDTAAFMAKTGASAYISQIPD